MTSTRMPYVIGNWKMNLDVESAMELAEASAEMANDTAGAVGVGVAIPYPWIPLISSELFDSNLLVGAQDVSAQTNGAHTGDVSAAMLSPWCAFTIVGHSERRQNHGESNDLVRAKLDAVLANDMAPVLCVGESQAERNDGRAFEVVSAQLTSALGHIAGPDLEGILIAYEPVWAIGTGITATPAAAQEMAAHIRAYLESIDVAAGARVPILYGGSV